MIAAMQGGGDDDKDNPIDKLSAWQKYNNIPIPIGWLTGVKDDFTRIPLPYGTNVFWIFGALLSNMLHNGIKAKEIAGAIGSIADSFNPFGAGTSDDPAKAIAKTVSPTLVEPFVEVFLLNENFMGKTIVPDYYWERYKPDALKYWKSSEGTIWKQLAWQMNVLTGGDKIRPGMIDVSPETLRYWFDWGFGGTGSFFRSAFDEVISPFIFDRELDVRRAPFVRRFTARPSENYYQQQFHTYSEEAQRINKQYKDYLKAGDEKSASQLRKKYGAAIGYYTLRKDGDAELNKSEWSLEVERLEAVKELNLLRKQRDAVKNRKMKERISNQMENIAYEMAKKYERLYSNLAKRN